MPEFALEDLNDTLSLNRLRSAGIDCPTVALGSTPSCSQPPESMKGITEFHPGNYIFYGMLYTSNVFK